MNDEANFMVEFLQGIDPSWLVLKYGYNGILFVDNGSVYGLNSDGRILIDKLNAVSAREIVNSTSDQEKRPGKFPWINPNCYKNTV